MDWSKDLGFKPEKEFKPITSHRKCYNCNSENVNSLDSSGWTEKFKCDKCGYITYVAHADFLSGALNENVAIDKKDVGYAVEN